VSDCEAVVKPYEEFVQRDPVANAWQLLQNLNKSLYSPPRQKLEGFLQYPLCACFRRQKFALKERGIPVDRSQLLNSARTNVADLSRGNLGVPLLLLVMLAMMMLPVPPFLLDVFFTFNIALSIVVLLVCVYALRPLDFAVFPTILLVATLLRLALNVASTRVVMLNGQDGHADAGKVIQAFGEVVIGGNDVVGIVVFAILMIINFV
jgi:flagellar biosynthesis protein FlhA